MSDQLPESGLPSAYLFLENEGRFIRFLFNRARTLIGSAPDNNIVIRDPSLLPRHAEIFVAGDEFHIVAVTGGRTEVAGEGVSGVRPLRNGDEIRLGNVVVLFTRESRMSDNTLNLIVERPGDIPFGVTIAKPIVRIGRSRGDLLIEDDTLLPTHALIENFCANGVFVLNVKGKGNTWLNGAPLDGRRRLHDGDDLRMGSTRISVSYAELGGAVAHSPRPRYAEPQVAAPPLARSPGPRAKPAPAPDIHREEYHTEMVDVSGIAEQKARQRELPPASRVVNVSVGAMDAVPLDRSVSPEEAAAVDPPREWKPPKPESSGEPLPAYPDIAAAEDFVGARHYLPSSYRAGRTKDNSKESEWGAAPEKTRRRPSQGNMTTAIPSPARVRRAVEEDREEGSTESLWYQPKGESKIVDD